MMPFTTIGEVSIELADFGLEDPGDAQLLHVAGVDLLGRMEALLIVVAVGVQEVGAVAGGLVEHRLRDRRHVGGFRRLRGDLFDLLGGRRADRGSRSNSAPATGITRRDMACLPRLISKA